MDATTTGEAIALQPGGTAHRIAPPDGARAPLKANIFEFAVGLSSQLQPMFPYDGAGAIVPCAAVMQGVDDGHYGHFFHFNTIEEIALVYGSNNAMLATGSVFATQQLHGVNSFLKDPADPDAFILITITQHQSEEGDQTEAVIFRCQKCSHELVRFGYDATPHDVAGHDASQWGGGPDDRVPMFATLWGSVSAAAEYNHEDVRTCSECGHLNPEFPTHLWGWQRWVTQWRTVNAARKALEATAAATLAGRRPAAAPAAAQARP